MLKAHALGSCPTRRPFARAPCARATGLCSSCRYGRLLRRRHRFGPWLPELRNRALPNWFLIAAGLLLSFVAVSRASRGRKLAATAILVVNLGLAGLWATMLYVNFVVPPSDGPAIGVRSADFALPDPSGRVVHLADFAGKPLLLVFYRGHWTVSELQGLQLRMAEFRSAVSRWRASVDSVEENAQPSVMPLEFPIQSAPKFDLIGAYKLRHPSGHDGHDIALSASVLLDGAGVVRWTFVTPNLRVRPTPDQVLAAIDALPR